MRGSKVIPLMSLTMHAPACRASSATRLLVVSMERIALRIARGDGFDHGDGAAQLLVFGHGFCARARRFAADVEDVRAFGEHLFGACERGSNAAYLPPS
jgi:hypothetical protein